MKRPTSKRKRCAHCKRVRLREFIEWHPGIDEWQCSDFTSCDGAIEVADSKRRHRKKTKLTGEDWSKVFKLRCRSKQGMEISKQDRALVDAAFSEDPKRYGAIEPDVFDATVPFGSSARWKR